MPDPAAAGQVRTHGAEPRRQARPPGRRLLLVLLAIGVAAGVVTHVAANPGAESDRSAITSPEADDPTTTITVPAVADQPVPDPLDRRVPGMSGSLVLTMGTADGTEVWRWSTGPEGVLTRSAPIPDVYDARPEPLGGAVAAIYRYGRRQPALLLGSEVPTTSVFLGVEGFAWNGSDLGEIVWVEQYTDPAVATIHLGRWVGDGVYFKPVGTIEGFDIAGGDHLVAFDALGLVFERIEPVSRAMEVTRVGLDGTVLGAADGFFAGSSGDGIVAVTDDRTRLLRGEDLVELRSMTAAYDSVVWARDGRFAATARDGTSIDLVDGFATRSVDVGDLSPAVLAWTTDGRFVIADGHVEGDPVLVFVDSATLDTTTLLVSAHPVAVVSVG